MSLKLGTERQGGTVMTDKWCCKLPPLLTDSCLFDIDGFLHSSFKPHLSSLSSMCLLLMLDGSRPSWFSFAGTMCLLSRCLAYAFMMFLSGIVAVSMKIHPRWTVY